jgi:hypothetical protein
VRRAALAAALGLAACAAPQSAPRPVGYVPDAEGIQIEGSVLRIDFGRSEAGVIAAMTRLEGKRPRKVGVRTTCPTGPMRAVSWDGGPTLFFANGAFHGWSSASDGQVVTGGVACGA